MKPWLLAILALVTGPGIFGQSSLSSDQIAAVRTILGDMRDAMRYEYYPTKKFDKKFEAACAAADEALKHARSFDDAFTLIADTLRKLDDRILFWPPQRNAQLNYGWEWQVLGKTAYITEIDQASDAFKQGLRRGDKVLSIEGIPLDRSDANQVHYLFEVLAPRAALHIETQAPRQSARTLSVATELRPLAKTRTVSWGRRRVGLERVETAAEKHQRELLANRPTLYKVGTVAVWRVDSFDDPFAPISDGLKQIADQKALILDLRGTYAETSDNVLRMLNGLFTDKFSVAKIADDSFGTSLRVHGRPKAFKGTVLVLVDSGTGGYAELFAKVLQKQQRGVIIGDYTMGRLFEAKTFTRTRGTTFNLTLAAVTFPAGEVTLEDGSKIDGHSIAPDYWLLPAPGDLAIQRDVVLAKAFAMLHEHVSPEQAFKMFWIDPYFRN